MSQFTLYGDLRRGRRPSFDDAMPPEEAERAYEAAVREARAMGVRVETGRFRAEMKVSSLNDGPVTIWIDSAVRERCREVAESRARRYCGRAGRRTERPDPRGAVEARRSRHGTTRRRTRRSSSTRCASSALPDIAGRYRALSTIRSKGARAKKKLDAIVARGDADAHVDEDAEAGRRCRCRSR